MIQVIIMDSHTLLPRYYFLQLLHPIGSPEKCILLTHWGRVGQIILVVIKNMSQFVFIIQEKTVQCRPRCSDIC